ncbi:MAG: amidohydrolase family protein [Planctomycetaceae bacterium]
MISDVNVWLSQWPSRRLPLDEPAALATYLRNQSVNTAWASSFDAILHQDLHGVNKRIVDQCSKSDGLLIPVGALNLSQPWWKDDLERATGEWGIRVFRLLPGYHGYELTDPAFIKLLDCVVARKLILQICVRLEDPRTQPARLRADDVKVRELIPLLKDRPSAMIILLNALTTVPNPVCSELATAGNVSFELSTLEGVRGVQKALSFLPPERILFGSHAPFFNWESAKLKMKESDLPGGVAEGIFHGNADRLLSGAGVTSGVR